MANYLALEEDGSSHYLTEEGDGDLLLEEPLLETGDGECGVDLEDDNGIIELEDGTGLLLLETCSTPSGSSRMYGIRRRQTFYFDDELSEEDEAFVLILASQA